MDSSEHSDAGQRRRDRDPPDLRGRGLRCGAHTGVARPGREAARAGRAAGAAALKPVITLGADPATRVGLRPAPELVAQRSLPRCASPSPSRSFDGHALPRPPLPALADLPAHRCARRIPTIGPAGAGFLASKIRQRLFLAQRSAGVSSRRQPAGVNVSAGCSPARGEKTAEPRLPRKGHCK